MLRPQHDDRRWPGRLRRWWAFAVVLAFVLTLCLPRERAGGPMDDPRTAPTSASPIDAGAPFSREAAFLPPLARGSFALQTMLAQLVEAHSPAAALRLWPRRPMSAEDFRRLYESDPGDPADFLFESR